MADGCGVGRVVLVAVTGLEQANDAERLRESLDWGVGNLHIYQRILPSCHPAILVTILLVLAPTKPGGRLGVLSIKLSRTMVASHPIFSRDFLETEGSIQLVLGLALQEMAQFSNYSARPYGDRRRSAVHWGTKGHLC
jgi:hypothetical protein